MFSNFFMKLLSLKNDVNAPLKNNKQKNYEKKIVLFLLASWMSMTKIAGPGSISPRHGSADPDPYKNVTDPQHWEILCTIHSLENRKTQVHYQKCPEFCKFISFITGCKVHTTQSRDRKRIYSTRGRPQPSWKNSPKKKSALLTVKKKQF